MITLENSRENDIMEALEIERLGEPFKNCGGCSERCSKKLKRVGILLLQAFSFARTADIEYSCLEN